MQKQYHASLQGLLAEELTTYLGRHFDNGIIPSALQSQLVSVVLGDLSAASTTAERQLELVASSMTLPILDFFDSSSNTLQEHPIIHSVSALRSSFGRRGAEMLQAVRRAFIITGKSHFPFAFGYGPSAPATPFIDRTRPVYEFIRQGLGIQMHGSDNFGKFSGPLGSEPSIGYNVSLVGQQCLDDSLEL